MLVPHVQSMKSIRRFVFRLYVVFIFAFLGLQLIGFGFTRCCRESISDFAGDDAPAIILVILHCDLQSLDLQDKRVSLSLCNSTSISQCQMLAVREIRESGRGTDFPAR